MFLHEIEITPELKDELNKAGIVVVHDYGDLLLKSRSLENSVKVRVAGQMLDSLLRHLRGYETPWSELRGKKVLDLASGSVFSKASFGAWNPHFSRLCAVNGARVVAMDINPQGPYDEKLFTGIKADIVDLVVNIGLPNHPGLQEASFDVIHSQQFVGGDPQPEVLSYLKSLGIDKEGFENKLLEQCGALLTEGGIMTIDRRNRHYLPIFYRKLNGQIDELPYTPPARGKQIF